MKRSSVVEIYAPTLGRKHDLSSTLIDRRAMPDGTNGKMYFGTNQKEYGTTLFATGSAGSALGSPVNLVFEAPFPNAAVLQILTHTGVYRYTSGPDAFVSDGQAFSGTFTDFWGAVQHNDAFIYCNGIDPLQYKASDVSTGTNMPSAISGAATYKSWGLGSFREHLNMYHTIEDGVEYYKRVRWTKKGVLTYSASTTDFDSGTAGAIDLLDVEGEVKQAVQLGPTMAIYADRSIHLQYWIGGDEVYQFTKTVSGIGTPSRRGVVSFGDVNYFIGQDSFYEYHGGDDLRDIGEPIKAFAFGEINRSSLVYSWVEVDSRYEEVIFHVPVGDDTHPSVSWVYRAENQSWSRLDDNYTAKGEFSRPTGTTIGELQGTIGDQQWKFGDQYIRDGAKAQIYADQSGRLVKKDNTVFSVSESGASAPRVFSYVTPDISGLPSKEDPYDKDRTEFVTSEKRYLGYGFFAVGNGTAHVYYSTDFGQSYVEFPGSPVTLVLAGTYHKFDLDVTGFQCRYKVTNTGTNDFIGVIYDKVTLLPVGQGD